MKTNPILFVVMTLVACLQFMQLAHAEQFQSIGDHQVHYIVFPTLTLKPAIAANYNVKRSQAHALLNISVLDKDSTAVAAKVSGSATNLLGQMQSLQFDEVKEGSAIYYLSELRHTDEEFIRFEIDITLPSGRQDTLSWQQKLYWER